MQIPNGPNGHPTVSPTMLRRYGSAGFRLAEGEEARGCPRLFRKQYVEKSVAFVPSYELQYGSLLHKVLERMETEDLSPEDLLIDAFSSYSLLGPEAMQEAKDDLERYMERGAAPRDRYGMIATERTLTALLYTDEVHGPIYFRAILDWVGIDLDDPGTVHVVDYKTNRSRSSRDDVRRDLQMRIQDLLTHLCSREIVGRDRIRVVVHLDEIKHDNGDIQVTYSDSERDTIHAFLIALVKHILRDEKGSPRLNPGCAYCPVKASCPAYKALPDRAQQVIDVRPDADETDDDALMTWRDKAWVVRGLLDKACKEIDAQMLEKAEANKGLVLRDYEYKADDTWDTVVDMRVLHARLQDQFYDVATVTQTALKALVKDWAPSDAQQILSLIKKVPGGSTMKKAKRK